VFLSNLDKLHKIVYLVCKKIMKPIAGIQRYVNSARDKGINTYRSYPFWIEWVNSIEVEEQEALGIYVVPGRKNHNYVFTKPLTEIRGEFFKWLKNEYQKKLKRKLKKVKKSR